MVKPILNFKPDILMAFGTTESVTKVVAGVGSGFFGGPTSPSTSWAMAGEMTRCSPSSSLTTLSASGSWARCQAVRQRFFAQFESEFKGFHSQKAPASFADTAYDATYLLAYSIVAINDQVMTGAKFNEGLKKMVGGTKITGGTTGINQALTLLQDKKSIDYDGVSGPLDFDVSTGEAPADIVVWCTGLNANSKAEFRDSGQFYDAVQNAVSGTRSNCSGLGWAPRARGALAVGTGGSAGAFRRRRWHGRLEAAGDVDAAQSQLHVDGGDGPWLCPSPARREK